MSQYILFSFLIIILSCQFLVNIFLKNQSSIAVVLCLESTNSSCIYLFYEFNLFRSRNKKACSRISGFVPENESFLCEAYESKTY